MKKSLIGLAVLATITTNAHAQSSVTLGGRMDAGITYVSKANTTGDSKVVAQDSGFTTSRWQLDGKEDLGQGIRAVFSLVSGLNAQTGANGGGTTRLFDRNAFVGIEQDGIGRLTLGRQESVAYDLMARFSPTSYSNTIEGGKVSNKQNVYGNITYSSNNASTSQAKDDDTVRSDNLIKYSGKFGGLSVMAAYAPGGQAGDGKAESKFQIGAAYDAKVAEFVITHSEYNVDDVSSGVTTKVGTAKVDTYGLRVPVGALTLKATYADSKAESTGALSQAPQIKLSSFGATYAINHNFDLTAFVYKKDVSNVATEYKQDTYGLLAEYKLSKRTKLYSHIANFKNSNNVDLCVTGSSTLGTSKTTAINAGIVHNF